MGVIFTKGSFLHLLALVLGIVASILVVLAVGVYLGYIPASWVDSLTAGQLGVLAGITIVGAAASYVAGERTGKNY